MWDGSSYKAFTDRTPNRRGEGLVKKGPTFSLRRTTAQIRVTSALGTRSEPIQARLFLHEVETDSITLFSSEPVSLGQNVSVTLEAPVQFYVRGTVVRSVLSTLDHKVLSEESYGYRVKIKFMFSSIEEARAVAAFRDHLISKYVMGGAV